MEDNVIYASTEEGDFPYIFTPQYANPICSNPFNKE
jgi:hypothetical protein